MAKSTVIYKLNRPFDDAMNRAVDQVYSTKGIRGVRFQGLSTVEIEYDPSRWTPVDLDRLLQTAGMPGNRDKGEANFEGFEETPALRAAARAFHALTKEEDWSKASAAYHEAYSLCGSSGVQELALRGEVCMWYGFALKNLFDLESISDRKPPTQDQLEAVAEIRRLWTEMLGIYSKLPYQSHRMDSSIVEQIRSHWIMPE